MFKYLPSLVTNWKTKFSTRNGGEHNNKIVIWGGCRSLEYYAFPYVMYKYITTAH